MRVASLASCYYLAPAMPEVRPAGAVPETHMALRTVYAPDVVGVDRLFLIAVEAPPGAPDLLVTVPDSVRLFDRTPSGAKAAVHRFYFRAQYPAERIEIRISLPAASGEAARSEIIVPLQIWSFEELRQFRRLGDVALPRRWPLGEALPELKQGRTVTTDAEIAALKGDPGPAPVWLEQPDDAIWAMQPDSTIPRWHWVNLPLGCPVHGTDIYRTQPYYPWEKELSLPWSWKIRCPVGGELYPSNDFGRGDMTGGAFADDGIGGGCLHDSRHYGFIAEICQAYCHQMLRVAPECARGYLATGDERYVHKALVAFCRLAVEYAYLATMTHHRHRNSVQQVERLGQSRFGEGPFLEASGFTVYCIDQPGYQWSHAEAYDRIFPAIDRDREIIPFLQAKGFPVKTHADVRRFIEENLFAVWMQGSMDGACHSNEPFEQRGLARTAEVLNYARGSDFMDWLYDGDGKMRVFVPNAYFRDGAPYESTGGYNGMHVSALGPIVDSIEHLRQLRPELYPEARYPALSKSRRYRAIFDFDMETVTIDRSFPAIGDTGSHPAYRKLARITWQSGGAGAFEHAYRLFRDPKFAWALVHHPGWEPSVNFPFTRAEMEREAAKWPDDWNDRSSLHDGYGLAILRGGRGDQKRALWLRYGRARSHTQDDLMDIGLQGYQGVLLSHMGYPRNWGYWEHCWMTHNVARQLPFATMTAQARLFAEAGPVRLTEARAEGFVDQVDAGNGYQRLPGHWQSRSVALVDAGVDQFYAVDFYRIAGGKEHWWCFHAQEGELATISRLTTAPLVSSKRRENSGLSLDRQQSGTLAGPDVPYGDPGWLKENGCTLNQYGWNGPMFGFAHLYDVERGPSDGGWSADWALKNADGLHLRLTVPEAKGAEVVLCDGRSPAGGSPYEMKWVLIHRQGRAPVKTQVLSIIEPYVETPVIREARSLKLSGEDESGFTASGCVLHLADRTDTHLFAGDVSHEHRAERGLRFQGRYGFLSEQGGVPIALSLVAGTRLTRGKIGIRLSEAVFAGIITRVDRPSETITVAPGWKGAGSSVPFDPAAIVGATIFIGSGDRSSAYRVLAARAVPEGLELRLDQDSRIGTGRVTGVEEFEVKTATPFPLHRFRYYEGARLVNADRTAEYRLIEVRSERAALIDRAEHPRLTRARLAREFPAGIWFDVYDYGVGDRVTWSYAVSITRTSEGIYRVESPVPVRVTLPPGCRVEE